MLGLRGSPEVSMWCARRGGTVRGGGVQIGDAAGSFGPAADDKGGGVTGDLSPRAVILPAAQGRVEITIVSRHHPPESLRRPTRGI